MYTHNRIGAQTKRARVGGVLAAIALAAGAGTVAAQQGGAQEYVPFDDIDPTLGYRADMEFSGTVRYWKDEETLRQYLSWVGDPENEWKLNYKHRDLEYDDLHGGHFYLEEGEEAFRKLSERHPEFPRCVGWGETDLVGAATRYPRHDSETNTIVTLESRIEHCAKAIAEQEIPQGSPGNTRLALYVKSLSHGMPINMEIGQPELRMAYERGKGLFYRKVGQFNFACATCHSPGTPVMGQRLRGQVSTTPFAFAAHFPTYRSARGTVETLQTRIGLCSRQMRVMPLRPGDPAYVDLEVFLTALSNGYPIVSPGVR
ncbi:sulfur oxidation c-type cytochrome SoxA [Thioalkalivibrio denitrificans]|uniref:sulfur oxidation c-type cytochrome SoxA n=1 Tax=Thioalkalivibrio denitrificans TaxID=108003 RepID=UPI000985F280|nr:sulfur oxidation c-type cytochrome SoxA [Thioalkalivibrio denitrificans]